MLNPLGRSNGLEGFIICIIFDISSQSDRDKLTHSLQFGYQGALWKARSASEMTVTISKKHTP